jgi:hypothetical protein
VTRYNYYYSLQYWKIAEKRLASSGVSLMKKHLDLIVMLCLLLVALTMLRMRRSVYVLVLPPYQIYDHFQIKVALCFKDLLPSPALKQALAKVIIVTVIMVMVIVILYVIHSLRHSVKEPLH